MKEQNTSPGLDKKELNKLAMSLRVLGHPVAMQIIASLKKERPSAEPQGTGAGINPDENNSPKT